MSDELINILSNSNKDIDNQKLMDYLSDSLSGKEKYEIEKLMMESDLINDAVEGLEQFSNKKNISAFVDQLNSDLHKQVKKKLKRKQRLRLKSQPLLYLSIIIILVLIIIAFVIITLYQQR